MTDADALARDERGLAVSVRGLSKWFGDRPVIDNLDLDVPAGQFLAIVGRSGCGKSTLLRLLTGLETPTRGSFRFGASGETTLADAKPRIMFQEPRLIPWARVAANVAIGLRGPDARASALAALDHVGLGDRADHWPSVLSGGQKQRVALARALVSRPRLLAFDEPLGALDALTRIEMQALVERVFCEQGFTAILVTHEVREAIALADRVVVIENGAIALDVDVPFPRPRRRNTPEAAILEDRILSRLLTPVEQRAA
jgi:sulfonate transport system ATP-binding protein